MVKYKMHVLVCGGTGCKASQSHEIVENLKSALVENGLIAGDDSEYGLYVKTVNGITLDYDKDGKYWAFYEENAYANQGVDSTPIKEGGVYTFKPE